ncbi:MAG: hypothetical protein JNK85_09850 [Verrucomicrobiales bacterium]|nr:hypothetical protein [Verrucomicrobiales bacterium]
MLPLLRSSPGLAISLALIVAGVLVSGLIGILFARGGASLRPVFWFLGFFMLVALPQFFGHLWLARRAWIREAPHRAAIEQMASATVGEEQSVAVERLFGADVDPRLVTDVRASMGQVFAEADLARFAVFSSGESVLIARFKSSSAAEKGWVQYLQQTGLSQLSGTGDSQRGYVVTRPAGDRAYALHLGTLVGVWTGPDDVAIRKRMASGGFTVPSRAPLAATGMPEPASTGLTVPIAGGSDLRLDPRWVIPILAVYLGIVVVYYFKGTAWAGTQRARPGVEKVGATELARRLESIGTKDSPLQIERGSTPDEWFATWRYADAKWIDLARARGMRRTFRIRLRLDEASGVVRATDYVAGWEASIGRGGAQFEWKAALGLVFAQYEHRRVFGFQWDETGRLKPDPSYAYTFNLKEMKSPLVETVTASGWDWRPTVWEGPRWLRWLTQ